MPAQTLSREEFMALGELAKARRQLVVNMFGGTRLTFGRPGVLSTARSLATNAKSIKSSVGKATKIGSAASKAVSLPGMREACEQLMVECADVHNIQDIIEAIGGEVF